MLLHLWQKYFAKGKFPSHSVVRGPRNQTEFYNYNNPKTVYYGSETLRSLGPKIWNILPSNIKTSSELVAFKTNIKTWIPTNRPRRLCKQYQSGLVFTFCFFNKLYQSGLVFAFCFFNITSDVNKPA